MKAAVVGLGLFGKSLALKLARAGAEVIAIDSKLDLVDDVKHDVALAVKLDATDERELRSQGVHQVDVLIASIGDNFEANQMVVILAKKMGIKRVLARAPSLVHARILEMIGAEEVILPEELAAEDLTRRIVEPTLKGYFQLIDGFSVAEIDAPPAFQGRKLADLDLKNRFRINLVAITRAGRVNAVPLGSDAIEKGDILAVAGRDADIKKVLEGNLS